MTYAAAWVCAGLVLATLEMLAPGAFLLWIGLGAIGTGAATALASLAPIAQLALFVTLTIALVAAIAPRRRPKPDLLNGPAANLIGQTCRALTFHDGQGRVTLGDGTWPARLTSPANPAPGQTLRIVALEGTTLLVSPP